MPCHRHGGMQSKSTPRPPPSTVDFPASVLGPSDEKPWLTSLETQCLHSSKEISTCQSVRGNRSMYSEKKVMVKPDKEAAVVVEALTNANGDHRQNVMLSPAKRKHQKYYLIKCIMSVCTNASKQLCFSGSCLLRLAIACICVLGPIYLKYMYALAHVLFMIASSSN